MTYYNKISKGYNSLHREEQEKKIAIILKNIKIRKSDKILDVGCGTAFFLELLHQQGHNPKLLHGIDPSKGMLKQCKDKEIVLEQGYAEKLPYTDSSFDIITCITAAHNFKDIKKGLSEIKRVAKPDATIVLSILKKSQKSSEITKTIAELFSITKILEEDKDVIFFVSHLRTHNH